VSDQALTIAGNLGEDPELRYTPNGAAVCNFDVAVSHRWNQDGEWKEQTLWMRVQAWRQLAENIAETCMKGTRVVVTGRLNKREWETREGDKRSAVEIVADDVAVSLKWATAKVERQKPKGRDE
jgi:single-strand DNA-binding protein